MKNNEVNNQIVEEKEIVEMLGEEFFKTPKEEFIEMSEKMSAKEYREWRKNIKADK